MKADRYAKDLFKQLNTFSNGNSSGGSNDEMIVIYDDEYCLARGLEPPRFKYYKQIRAEKYEALRKSGDHTYHGEITQDELDFILKRDLWLTPEERYQAEKRNWFFHDLSVYMKNLSPEEGYGCTNLGCIPECRYYADQGRIEDQEIIDEHTEFVESLKQANAIVQPPSEEELLKLAKV